MTATVDVLARAERVLAGRALSDAIARPKAIVGPRNIPASEPAAQRALDKLRDGETPTGVELASLEVMIRIMRPALFVEHGIAPPLPDYLNCAQDTWHWDRFRAEGTGLTRSVGRIDVGKEQVASGFVVAPGVLATNRHVVDALTAGTRVLDPDRAVVCFRREYRSNDFERVRVLGIEGVHGDADLALLRIADETRPPLSLGEVAPAVGTPVAVIGHPTKDEGRNPIFVSALLDDPSGVKRASPGELIATDSRDYAHDCTTLGGSSGSPVVDLASLNVIAVHRSGYFLYRNEAVPAPLLRGLLAETRTEAA